jgi:hypothetical protein
VTDDRTAEDAGGAKALTLAAKAANKKTASLIIVLVVSQVYQYGREGRTLLLVNGDGGQAGYCW